MKTTALARTRRFLRDTRGANMVEYIILTGVIALFALFAFNEFGGAIKKTSAAQKEGVELIETKTREGMK
jgi:Flp pilus assembly pilin Flp